MSADLDEADTTQDWKNKLNKPFVTAIVFAGLALVLPGPLLITKIYDNDHISVPLAILMASGPLLIGLGYLLVGQFNAYRTTDVDECISYRKDSLYAFKLCAFVALAIGIGAFVVALLGTRSYWLYDTLPWTLLLGIGTVGCYVAMLQRLLTERTMGVTFLCALGSLPAVWYLASMSAAIANLPM